MSTQEFEYHLTSIQTPLLGYAFKLTRSEEDAKDLLQETIYKALTNVHRFTPSTNLKAWTFTIMRNTFLNLIKRNKVILAESHDISIENSYGSHNDSESLKDQKDIQLAIDNLPLEFKEPFVMHYEGFKYNEIADELNIPLSKVKNRIHHARKKLTVQLKDFEYHN